jgi:hypothetical protein
MIYYLIPTMPEVHLRPIMERFGQLLLQKDPFAGLLG